VQGFYACGFFLTAQTEPYPNSACA